MKTFLVASLFSAILAATASAAEAPAKPTIANLSWLAGTWSFERNGRVVTERWTPPSGGMMMGTSQTVVNNRTVEYEFVTLGANAAGDIIYLAKPSRQREAAFRLVSSSERSLVFENPEHDFPQRISYVLKDDGTLLAAIEGTKDGKTRRVEFPYRPVK
jgi:hypothetical protein